MPRPSAEPASQLRTAKKPSKKKLKQMLERWKKDHDKKWVELEHFADQYSLEFFKHHLPTEPYGRYLTSYERPYYEVTVYENLWLQVERKQATVMDGIYIYVIDGQKKFYAAKVGSLNEVKNHTDFVAGKAVICAGMMYIDKGVLKILNNRSGHYHPDLDNVKNGLSLIIKKLGFQLTFLVEVLSQDKKQVYSSSELYDSFQKGTVPVPLMMQICFMAIATSWMKRDKALNSIRIKRAVGERGIKQGQANDFASVEYSGQPSSSAFELQQLDYADGPIGELCYGSATPVNDENASNLNLCKL